MVLLPVASIDALAAPGPSQRSTLGASSDPIALTKTSPPAPEATTRTSGRIPGPCATARNRHEVPQTQLKHSPDVEQTEPLRLLSRRPQVRRPKSFARPAVSSRASLACRRQSRLCSQLRAADKIRPPKALARHGHSARDARVVVTGESGGLRRYTRASSSISPRRRRIRENSRSVVRPPLA